MTLGADVNYILNRAQTLINFSRLVLTKSRRRSYDLSNGLSVVSRVRVQIKGVMQVRSVAV